MVEVRVPVRQVGAMYQKVKDKNRGHIKNTGGPAFG